MVRRCYLPGALATLAIVLLISAGCAATPPTTITVVPDHVVIENCTYSTTATLGNLDGTGTLRVKKKFNGVVRSYSFGSVQLKTLGVDSTGLAISGYVKVGNATVENFLGSGFTLNIASGNVATQPNKGIKAELSCSLVTPFNDAKGNPLNVKFSGGGGYMQFSAYPDGSFFLTGTDGQAIAADGNDGTFATGGVSAKPTTFPSLNLTATEAEGAKFTLTCGSGAASVSIPELVTYDGTELPLKFNQMEINERGEITAQGMTLKEPTTIALASPSDFFLEVVSTSVNMDHGKLTKYDLQAHVVLPQALSPSPDYRNKINNIQFDLMKHAVVDLPQTMRLPEIQFNGYRLNAQNIVLDFSREGPDDLSTTPGINGKSWQGIYARSATVTMPSEWTDQGGPFNIETKDVLLETAGVSCTIEAPASKLGTKEFGGFNCHLTQLKIDFKRNDIVDSQSGGSVDIQGLGTLNLDVKVATTGTTVTVKNGQTLKSPSIGMTLTVDSGQLLPDADGLNTLWLDGSMGWNVPKYAGLSQSLQSFHGLGIDNKFQFVFNGNNGITLDNPVDADFGIFKCNIASVALVLDNGKWVADFDGELSLNSDLPVTGTISFEKLRIFSDGGSPSVALNGVTIEAEIKGVVRLDATIDKKLVNGRDRLTGAATLSIIVAGDSEPMKGSFELVVEDDGVWGVAGKAYMPTPIAIGTTPLGFYAFKGGIAHNMTAPEGFQSVNDLASDPGSGKWLFMAGCDVGALSDPRLFYAEADLSIGLPQFIFDLRGRGWVLSEDRPVPAPLEVSVTLDPTVPSLRVGADVNLQLPPGFTILSINGGLEVLLSPDDCHVAIGWPYPDAAVGCSVLGAWDARFGMLATPNQYTCSAGAGFSYWPFSGSIEGTFGYNFGNAPYLVGSLTASGEVDFWVASIGASANVAGELWDDGLHCNGTFCAEIGMPWPIPDWEGCVGLSAVVP